MATTNAYVSVTELRDRLGDSGERLDESLLERAANVASRAVDRYCGPGRRFWRDAGVTTRVYRVDRSDLAWVDDFSGTAGLIVRTDDNRDGAFETTWSSEDYQPEPLNGDVVHAADTVTAHAYWQIAAVGRRRFPYAERRAVLQVTARFGWSAVPDDVAEAAALHAVRLFRRKDAPFGVAGFGDFGAVRITPQDADVASLLADYRRFRPRTLAYRPQRHSLFHGGDW